MNLTKLVLRRPVSTALIVLGIFVFGIFSIPGFDMELIPDIDLPMYLIYTVYPGASPTSIDELVTSKIEDSAETLSGVDSVISYSYNNYSMVGLTYDYDQNMNDAYTSLSAALDVLNLPDDCQDPVIIEMDVKQEPTVMISATANGSSDMMAYIDETVVPALESVSNVARVEVTGGRSNYVRVRLNEDRMRQYGVNISTISSGNLKVSMTCFAEYPTVLTKSGCFLNISGLLIGVTERIFIELYTRLHRFMKS